MACSRMRISWSEERGESIWESFRRIIRLVGREKPDFLLIAGDLFQRQPLLQELKEINDLCVHSGDDRRADCRKPRLCEAGEFYRGFDWADNVVLLLSPEPECVEVPEKKTAVYGCSYDKEILENRLDDVTPEGEDEVSSAARTRRRCPPHAVESGAHGAGGI